VARAFGIDETAWVRHANPWSVWMRNTVLPLIVLAIWSRVWLGGWSLVPLSLAMLLTWLKPFRGRLAEKVSRKGAKTRRKDTELLSLRLRGFA
jgi:hypothetical protein